MFRGHKNGDKTRQNRRRPALNNRRELPDNERHHLKRKTVYLTDQGYSHREIYDAITAEKGRDAILGLVVKTNGTWQLTNTMDTDIDNVMSNGMGLRGQDVDVRTVGRNIVTVSFFGVPVFVSNKNENVSR